MGVGVGWRMGGVEWRFYTWRRLAFFNRHWRQHQWVWDMGNEFKRYDESMKVTERKSFLLRCSDPKAEMSWNCETSETNGS